MEEDLSIISLTPVICRQLSTSCTNTSGTQLPTISEFLRINYNGRYRIHMTSWLPFGHEGESSPQLEPAWSGNLRTPKPRYHLLITTVF